MPYQWITPASPDDGTDMPVAELHLWPYRSLLRRDFVTFISLTATLTLIPLSALLGSPILWGILPFLLLMLWGIWYAIQRNYRDGEILEELRLWPGRVTLDRHDRKGGHRNWEANPYWVQLQLHEEDGPVKNYLTLKGGPREVELGAFLSEEERLTLYHDLRRHLRNLDAAP